MPAASILLFASLAIAFHSPVSFIEVQSFVRKSGSVALDCCWTKALMFRIRAYTRHQEVQLQLHFHAQDFVLLPGSFSRVRYSHRISLSKPQDLIAYPQDAS